MFEIAPVPNLKYKSTEVFESKCLISSVSVWVVNFIFKCFSFLSAISFPILAIAFLSSLSADFIFDLAQEVATNLSQSSLGLCFFDVITST